MEKKLISNVKRRTKKRQVDDWAGKFAATIRKIIHDQIVDHMSYGSWCEWNRDRDQGRIASQPKKKRANVRICAVVCGGGWSGG